MPEDIPKYAFNNRTNPHLGFEIIPLQRIYQKATNQAFHFHRLDFHQILFYTGGSGVHHVDFKEIPFQAGSVIPVAKGQVQKFESNDKTDGFSLLFTSEFLLKEADSYKYLYDFIIFNHSIEPVSFQIHDEIQSMVDLLKKEQENALAFHQEEYTKNLIKLLLISLERTKRSHTDIVCAESLNLYQLFRVKLEKELSYKIKVADFCDAFHVTAKRINTAIKRYTGSTAKEVIDERIVLECKRLLTYSDLSIKEIAYKIGFEDPTNFTKYFKKHVEISPIEFRNQNEHIQ